MKGTIKIEFEGNSCLNCPFCYHSLIFEYYICTADGAANPYRLIPEHGEDIRELGTRPDGCPISEEN